MARFPVSEETRALLEAAAREPDRGAQIARYTEALAREPECTYALVHRGLALQEARRLDEALADYERAIVLDPTYGLAYYGRGWARHWKRNFKGELEDARHGLTLDPGNRGPYLRRIGSALQGLGEHWQAIAAFSEAIELNPDDEGTIYNRAVCYLGMRKYYEAIVDLTRALELDPDWTWALTRRAAAYVDTGRLAEAQADIDLALQIDPDDTTAQKLKQTIAAKVKWKRSLLGRLLG